VARIVAETMDNYLIMGHILRCKLIPKEEVHPELWVGANRKWRTVPRQRVVRREHNKVYTSILIPIKYPLNLYQFRTEEQQHRAESRLLKRQNERKRKLQEAGISYSFENVGYVSAPFSYFISV
jgi:nucleolar protein 15